MSQRPVKKTMSRKPSERKRAAPRHVNGTPAQGQADRPEPSGSRYVNGAAGTAPTVHCMLAPMDGESMLLPTNAIAEVIEYVKPAALPNTPDWFLGQVEWENRQIPVFSYSALISGDHPAEATGRTRIMIIKSLSDSARVPYLGIVISDIPRLINVQPDQLEHMGDERKSMGVYSHVNVQEHPAVIPDLERLTHLVTHTAYGMLPITQLGSA